MPGFLNKATSRIMTTTVQNSKLVTMHFVVSSASIRE